MNKKQTFTILLLTVLFMSLAVIAITLPEKVTINIIPEKQTPKPTPMLSLGARVDNGKIVIYINPLKTSLNISAFALRADIKGSFDVKGVLTGDTLIQNGWVYPFSKISAKGEDSFSIEVSAFHIGKNPYTIDEEVVLVYIPLSQSSKKQSVSLSVDETVTQFLAEDAISKIPILVK